MKYRIVTDQASIGVEPITPAHTIASHGTFNGRVYVLQRTTGHAADGWEFLAAYAKLSTAQAQMRHLKIEPARGPRPLGMTAKK